MRFGTTKDSMLAVEGTLEHVCGIKADLLFIPGSCHRAPKTLGISWMTRGTFVALNELLSPVQSLCRDGHWIGGLEGLRVGGRSPKEQTS